jgi:nucleoside 2-deoxyribosyltransferase
VVGDPRSSGLATRAGRLVYISGPLQSAADLSEARLLYELLAEVCVENGLRAYLPHLQTDPEHHSGVNAQEVFEQDYRTVADADLIIAHIGTPSSGVGAELGIAFERRIPMIAIYRDDERPSRFLLGMIAATNMQAVTYTNGLELRERLSRALRWVMT